MLPPKSNSTQLLWVNPNSPNYPIIKITKMPLKWKSQHFLGFPFPLSLVSILGIKKFHISTSTSAIILKIQIKKIFSFLFYFLSLSWQPNSATNTKKCYFKLKTFLEFRKQLSLKQIEILLNQKKRKMNTSLSITPFLNYPNLK